MNLLTRERIIDMGNERGRRGEKRNGGGERREKESMRG